MMYNKIVEECFFYPKHVGVIDTAKPYSVCCSGNLLNQGVQVALYLECSPDHVIESARFKATGNPYVIAALEWLCRQIEGRDFRQLPTIDYQVLVKVLEIPQPMYALSIHLIDIYQQALALMVKKFKG